MTNHLLRKRENEPNNIKLKTPEAEVLINLHIINMPERKKKKKRNLDH